MDDNQQCRKSEYLPTTFYYWNNSFMHLQWAFFPSESDGYDWTSFYTSFSLKRLTKLQKRQKLRRFGPAGPPPDQSAPPLDFLQWVLLVYGKDSRSIIRSSLLLPQNAIRPLHCYQLLQAGHQQLLRRVSGQRSWSKRWDVSHAFDKAGGVTVEVQTVSACPSNLRCFWLTLWSQLCKNKHVL